MFFKKKDKGNNEEIWIVAGLGDPGPEYETTRHNCGFLALDALSERTGIEIGKKKFKGVYGDGRYVINGQARRLVLLKPETYMNNSGESISAAMSWIKVKEDHLIVIYDDTDIDMGAIRVRPNGSAGTHNGMKSILQYTDSDKFPRVRVGIGKRPEFMDMVKFVLGHFDDNDMKNVMKPAFERAAEAVVSIIGEGTDKAMNRFNGKAGGNSK